jgi:hypothetical protein
VRHLSESGEGAGEARWCGYDVAAHAMRVAPRAAMLLTSGFIEEAATRGAERNPPILWKPVRPQELVATVRDLLSARHSACP